jgi:hypothetical protein
LAHNLKQIIFGGVCVCRMNEASTIAIFGFAELAEWRLRLYSVCLG